jgi:hypothetical protein
MFAKFLNIELNTIDTILPMHIAPILCYIAGRRVQRREHMANLLDGFIWCLSGKISETGIMGCGAVTCLTPMPYYRLSTNPTRLSFKKNLSLLVNFRFDSLYSQKYFQRVEKGLGVELRRAADYIFIRSG